MFSNEKNGQWMIFPAKWAHSFVTLEVIIEELLLYSNFELISNILYFQSTWTTYELNTGKMEIVINIYSLNSLFHDWLG